MSSTINFSEEEKKEKNKNSLSIFDLALPYLNTTKSNIQRELLGIVDNNDKSKTKEKRKKASLKVVSGKENKNDDDIEKYKNTNSSPSSSLLLTPSSKKKKAVGLKKDKIILPPLPKHLQEKIERQVAYKESSKDISKWLPIVTQNRKAEHLTLPNNKSSSKTLTCATLLSSFEPSTSLEKQVETILKNSSQKDEKDKRNFITELPDQPLSLEEMRERQIELQKIRSFLFYQQQKSKRISKIKSKTYHRIKNKDRRNHAIDKLSVMDENALLKEKMKIEVERAKERISLRHRKSHHYPHHDKENESFFSKHQQMMKDLHRIEELKEKMGVDNGSFLMNDDDDDDDENDDQSSSNRQTRNEQDSIPKMRSGLLKMKFMQQPYTKSFNLSTSENSEDSEMDDDDLEESNDHNFQSSDDGNSEDISNPNRNAADDNLVSQQFLGRRKYTCESDKLTEYQGKEKTEKSSSLGLLKKVGLDRVAEESSSDNKKRVRLMVQDVQDGGCDTSTIAPVESLLMEDDLETKNNPWIEFDQTSEIPKKNSRHPEQQSKRRSTQSSSSPLVLPVGINPNKKENNELSLISPATIQLSKDLLEKAFVGDDVIQSFEEEKKKLMEEEAPHDVDVTLPGWGSWGGVGIDSSQTKRFIKKAQPGEGILPSKRKDAHLKHVIINEKKTKSIEKYQIEKIPHPFENKLQYESTQSLPIGKEWNTLTQYQKRIQPRIQLSPGNIIKPLRYSKKIK